MQHYKVEEFFMENEKIVLMQLTAEEEHISHTHGFIELVYISDGSGIHNINEVSYKVHRGDMLFINFKEVHSFRSDKGMRYVNCLINPEFISSELVRSENAMEILALTAFKEFHDITGEFHPNIRFLGKELLEIETILDYMCREFKEKIPGYRTVLKGYVNVLLTKVFRAIKNSDSLDIAGSLNRIAPQVLKYIEDNYDRKISLKELARYSCYNANYFSTMFKECFGKTLTEYVNEKRMEEAARLLKSSGQPIEDICFNVGFKDKTHFYNLFKHYTGLTPKQFRQKE